MTTPLTTVVLLGWALGLLGIFAGFLVWAALFTRPPAPDLTTWVDRLVLWAGRGVLVVLTLALAVAIVGTAAALVATALLRAW